MTTTQFEACTSPPPCASTVLVAAIYDDSVVLQARADAAPSLPQFAFRAFEPLEAIVKANMLLELGALVQRTRLVGALDGTPIYAAIIAALDRPAPAPPKRTHVVPLDEAARLLHAQLGRSADRILNELLWLRSPDTTPRHVFDQSHETH